MHKVVCMKSAQAAWTDGVLNNYVGRRIDLDPCAMVVMFPKEASAKEYTEEKLGPMIEATPRLARLVDISKSRSANNRQLFKNFPGGFLKLVGSGSTASVKSTPAPVVIVEEPDDCVQNLKGQGDTIRLLEERTKTFPRRKIIFGGTPTVKGVSAVEDAYAASDQRKFWVPCHQCNEAHVLDWGNVVWSEDREQPHEVYGRARPETAAYACPHCGALWSDADKNRNVQRAEGMGFGWRSGAEFRGVAGFFIQELLAPWLGSQFARLVERYLAAKRLADQGDDADLIVFTNSCLGLPYEYATGMPAVDELQDRGEQYDELTVPAGGMVLTAGVDVQHDRLAVIVRAWGRDEESWLIYWGEVHGNTADKADPVWADLDALLWTPRRHASGARLVVCAVSIDSSDGGTSDAVYAWVRKHSARRTVMAVKGSSTDTGNREIFSRPAESIDTKGSSNTKASRYGLRIYLVGTSRGKDLIHARIKLRGGGPGRMHNHAGVRSDYYEQIVSEVKVPSRTSRGKKVWTLKAGKRNEALDAEVYAAHAARAKRVHLLRPEHWDDLARKILQPALLPESVPADGDGVLHVEQRPSVARPVGYPDSERPPTSAPPPMPDGNRPRHEAPPDPAPSGVFIAPSRTRRVRSAGVRG